MIKTVGIITTFRQPNWGSVLQAYALQKVLDDMGFEAWLIDYRYPNEFHYSRGLKRPRSWVRNLPGNILTTIKEKIGVIPVHKMVPLNRFIKENIRVTRPYNSYEDLHENPPLFDIYIAGSDQIWNPLSMLGDMSYLLDFASDESKKLSYSSSFSGANVPEKLRADYKKNLKLLSAISVREDNGTKLVKEISDCDAQVVLDPTILLDYNHWTQFSEKAKKVSLPDKYILSYMLGYSFTPDNTMAKVLTQLQKQYQLPVVALNALPSNFHGEVFQLPHNYGIGIEEFLYLLNRSYIVASSSFHGTAFALNFGKPLVAIADGNVKYDDRISSLINKMSLKSQMVLSTDIENIHNLDPFYNVENEQGQLRKLREESMRFLQKALFS